MKNLKFKNNETASLQPRHTTMHPRESVIFYRSWFNCLNEYPDKECAMAIMALLSYAFNGDNLESFHLPKVLEYTLKTFIPTINRQKRKGRIIKGYNSHKSLTENVERYDSTKTLGKEFMIDDCERIDIDSSSISFDLAHDFDKEYEKMLRAVEAIENEM